MEMGKAEEKMKGWIISPWKFRKAKLWLPAIVGPAGPTVLATETASCTQGLIIVILFC